MHTFYEKDLLFIAIRVIDVCADIRKELKMSSEYNYNLTGAERKTFVGVISEILGEPAVYQRAPSFSYQIGYCIVDKNGVLSCPEEADSGKLNELVKELGRRGYTAEATGNLESAADEEATTQPDEETEAAGRITTQCQNAERENGLDIELPITEFDENACHRLTQIIASKSALLRKVLGTDDLSVVIKGDKLVFRWFTLHDIDGEADAYACLVTALVKMAKTQKRVTAKAKEITNEKFTMRLFLIRLGFIGDEYKTARKILLRNLTGNSSWKAGQPPERAPEAAVEGIIEPVAPGSAEAPEIEHKTKEGGVPYDKE